jgi:hypothetical protein
MTLKVTLTINQDFSEDLIGLLTKAFGRGELGIGDIKIERADPLDVGLKAIKQSQIAKLVAKAQEPPKLPKPKIVRKGYSLGMRAFRTGKPNGVTIALTGLEHDATRDGLRAMFRAQGVNPNGLSPTLTKLKKRGYVVLVSAGVWRLTPKGMDFVKQWRAQHDDPGSE